MTLTKTLLVTLLFVSPMASRAQHSSLMAPEAFAKKIAATPAKTILDVRTPEEFEDGHIANAVSINWYGSDFKERITTLKKDQPVFVYCAGGVRSAKAAKVLKEAGFKQIIELQGGFGAWKQAGKPSVK